jgi:diaminopimelate epimerase
MQATGNDFVMLESDAELSRLAIAVCDRHFGVGADGLIAVTPAGPAQVSMRIWNADGSEAEACGNGLRCAVRYAVDQGLVAAGSTRLSVSTIAGERQAEVTYQAGAASWVRVGMGAPEFEAAKIPVIVTAPQTVLDSPLTVGEQDFKLSFVAMGNPHAVLFQDSPVSEFPLSDIGPMVEHLEIFPNRANFEVVRRVGENRFEQRTWERGVGETLACGSGACAVAVVARRQGLADGTVTIELAGGEVTVDWDGTGEVYLSGPAHPVFEGVWPDA